MAAISLMDTTEIIFVLQENYQIDSADLRRKYTFLNNSEILFSDSLYHLYSLNDQMTVSNPDGTLKCPLKKYGTRAHKYFSKWNSENDIDSIQYSYPIAKASIIKRNYTNDGKVYLLNTVANNVLIYDLLQDEMLDTVSISEQAKKDIYFAFGMNKNKDDYEYYKNLIVPHIQDPLCTINDIVVDKDTLYLYVSSYFVYFKPADKGEDTILTHFQSILMFYQNQYITSYVPTNIMERLIETSKDFYAESNNIHKYKDNFYITIYNNSLNYKGTDKYLVGKFSPKDKNLDWVIKLTGEMSKSYNFSKPLFSNHYGMSTKSTKLYDLENKDNVIDLPYFKQELDYNGGIIPKYYNTSFFVNNNICHILYFSTKEHANFYAQINLKSNKILMNKSLPQLNPKSINLIDPYNPDFIIQYMDNYKVIRYKIKS